MAPAAADHSCLEGERQLGTPVVLVDRPSPTVVCDTVLIDNGGGVRSAVRSLLAHGHRRVAAIADTQDLFTARERVLAFTEAMSDAGLPGVAGLVRSDVHDIPSAYAAMLDLLDGPRPPTAVLALNNRISLGVLKALRGRGPTTALIGFDDFDLADVLGVTVVAHDPDDLGRRAGELALSALADRTRPPQQVVVPTRLVERGSGGLAAPAPRRQRPQPR